MTDVLDDLRRQLVASSRHLSWEAGARPKRSRWRRPARRSMLMLAGVLVVSGSAIATTTQLDDSLQVVDRAQRLPEGTDHRIVRANGLDPAAASPAFTTAGGLRIAVLGDERATCVLVSDGNDQCFRASAITLGLGFSIASDCATGGAGVMRVVGVAPPGSARVSVAYSSGRGLASPVSGGAFVIEARTPVEGRPHPVAVRYLDGQGSAVATAPIRQGDNPCLRAAG